MHNFRANYEKILEVLKELELDSENFLSQIHKPKLTDLRIIAINLTSEYMSIDSEHQLFRILPSEIKSLIERSVYNRRKRRLFFYMEHSWETRDIYPQIISWTCLHHIILNLKFR